MTGGEKTSHLQFNLHLEMLKKSFVVNSFEKSDRFDNRMLAAGRLFAQLQAAYASNGTTFEEFLQHLLQKMIDSYLETAHTVKSFEMAP